MSMLELNKNTFSGDNDTKKEPTRNGCFLQRSILELELVVCRISNGHKVSSAFLSFNNQPCIFFLREKSWLKCPLRMVPKKNEQYVHKS